MSWVAEKTPCTQPQTDLAEGQSLPSCLGVPTYLREQSNGKPQATCNERKFHLTMEWSTGVTRQTIDRIGRTFEHTYLPGANLREG
jgi:hypothetical protein